MNPVFNRLSIVVHYVKPTRRGYRIEKVRETLYNFSLLFGLLRVPMSFSWVIDPMCEGRDYRDCAEAVENCRRLNSFPTVETQ